jgi:hypothetical protein
MGPKKKRIELSKQGFAGYRGMPDNFLVLIL